MSEIINDTKLYNPILSYVFFIVFLPNLLIGVALGIGIQLLISFVVLVFITSFLIFFKVFRIIVYDSELVKKFLNKKRNLTFSPNEIHFKFADYRYYVMTPSVLIYNKNEVIGGLNFSSMENLENFVMRTKNSGYRWSQPTGNGSVWKKIRFLIRND